MTFQEAVGLLDPDCVTRFTAHPTPLRDEQGRRIADLITRDTTQQRPGAA